MCFLFFFKQKTAYDVRISDWSSDVCSSDLCFCRSGFSRELLLRPLPLRRQGEAGRGLRRTRCNYPQASREPTQPLPNPPLPPQGRELLQERLQPRVLPRPFTPPAPDPPTPTAPPAPPAPSHPHYPAYVKAAPFASFSSSRSGSVAW